jgi:predicted P-loop ATPase
MPLCILQKEKRNRSRRFNLVSTVLVLAGSGTGRTPLVSALLPKSARVSVIALESTTKEKLGLDDFLAAGGTLTELKKIKLTHKIFKNNGCHKKPKQKDIEVSGEPQRIINIVRGFKYEFRYNVVLCEIEFSLDGSEWRAFDDRRLHNLLISIRSLENFDRLPKDVLLTIINSDLISPEYDPFALFFEQNEWDGKDRFMQYLSFLTPKDPDTKKWAEKVKLFYRWMINAAGCLLGEVRNESCLVLQGEQQGTGKTTWLNSLFSCIPEFEKYLTVEKIIDSKSVDSMRNLCERGLINLDELDDLSKSQVTSIKRIFSLEGVSYRIPFDRFAGKKKRRANFCGSSNETQFLCDSTGSRRWFILPVSSVNLEALKLFDFRQLWAQAYNYYRDNFTYWMSLNEINALNEVNEEHYTPTVPEELLLARCCEPKKCTKGAFLTTTELGKALLENDVPDDAFVKKLGKALKKHGYERKKIDKLYRYLIEFKLVGK